jgi:hypothetical protein
LYSLCDEIIYLDRRPERNTNKIKYNKTKQNKIKTPNNSFQNFPNNSEKAEKILTWHCLPYQKFFWRGTFSTSEIFLMWDFSHIKKLF